MLKENLKRFDDELSYVGNALGHFIGLDPKTVAHLLGMPKTTANMAWVFVKRSVLASHPERRHPEYRIRMTMMCMGHYWGKSTGLSFYDYPLAAEATSIFVNYIYALDDFIDEGPAAKEHMSLREIEEAMNVNGYDGRDMNWHFTHAVRRGTNPESAGWIADRVQTYVSGFYGRYQDGFVEVGREQFTIEELVKYRDSVSAEMGRVIADILNRMANATDGQSDNARRNLGMVTMVGQLHDEYWDLVTEFDSGRNILAEIIKKNPSEALAVKRVIKIIVLT